MKPLPSLQHGRPTHSLAGRVAIVTGAGTAGDGIGNGRASAILLAEDGCSVVCVDLDLACAQRTVEMIEAEAKGRAVAVRADVTSEADVQRIVRTAVDAYGRIDILFNCVGVGGPPGTALDVDMTAWARGMEINVGSMVLVAKHVIPVMLRNDDTAAAKGYRGSIINMGSVGGLRGGTPALLYPTSKGAVVNMTRAMAAHHGRDGIRVNCLCPGMVFTPMMYAGPAGPAGNGSDGVAVTMSDDAREARRNRNLLKTEGTGWDVGAAVRFLAGDEARWITGLIMELDAGATAATSTDLPKSASVGS